MRAFLLLMAALPAWGQQAFETASVKLTPPAKSGSTVLSPQGAPVFSAAKVTLEFLIELAFGVDENQLSGEPAWLKSQQYDVTAKPPGTAGLTYREMRPMLQQLLVQKFHLAVHREMKDVEGYALVVAKGGAKLTPASGDSERKYILPSGIRFGNTSIATFAAALARSASRPVVDKTGLEGNYDINLEFAAPPALFSALEEQLGLRLEPRKVPFEMLVIDKVDRLVE